MTGVVVVGMQWGDEGKGKITDFLSRKAQIVARYQGGDNAGHTVEVDDKAYKMRLVPSGILNADRIAMIGNGVVVNPKSLVAEMATLQDQGVSFANFKISNRAQVILPYHIKLDGLQEQSKGANKIGTTNRGIGPAYMDKVARVGIRMADLIEKDTFAAKLKANLAVKNREFTKLYDSEPLQFEEIFTEYYQYGQQLRPYVCDTSKLLNEELNSGAKVLFEGAQGIMLDIDHGTYPFVTSSNPVGGYTAGLGVGPTQIHRIVGVAKAYTSRVGAGPFPTELTDATGDFIRDAGHEYGVVTKRPRRIGWLDAVVLQHAQRVAGITDIALNSIDVLSGLQEVKICTGYKLPDGQIINEYPASLNILDQCQPVYVTMPGWQQPLRGITDMDAWPQEARNYLAKIKELTGLDFVSVSVGPNRDETIVLKNIW
ncbi:MAG: adenylosuccinate synthase [Lactobacillus sp.]|uniref:adenylosuccinate synthase n=1 Tax=Bombilactobacillus bombi TaxID=1303590 RepID=UPI000E5708FC|nr:adenylosuccinate synthase [Bombilactobacillus bombi]AXX65312.1 adenylosuccinate synthase [Bombilactobacillus bombi]MCO6541904.1 adenylosuccinate synthase [Lactobacillus sp.]MCO6543684.1 adenylosuccinate synthase [Lactobacillus sp.]